jgi:hypothetical protein
MAIENLQPLCYTVITITFVIGTLSIFLRLYTRSVIMNVFSWDDGVALLLLVKKFFFLRNDTWLLYSLKLTMNVTTDSQYCTTGDFISLPP